MPSGPSLPLPDTDERLEKRVFVIMPFRQTPLRNTQQLTAFFRDQICAPIENERNFRFRYRVRRSENDFNITEQIIRDLASADIVICDLSGETANPNVMYELGVRLTCSTNPVILIRENNHGNQTIFDIAGFHTHSYDPLDYASLVQYLRDKIARFESGEEIFRSPVLSVLENSIPIIKAGRDKATTMANVLEVGLFSYLIVLSSRLRDFVNEHEEIETQISGNGFNLPQELYSISQEEVEFDWSELRIIFGAHPALINFISQQPLSGIIDFGMEVKLTTAVMAYYMNYFLEAAWWFRIDIRDLISFVDRTLRLMKAFNLLAEALRATTSTGYENGLAQLAALLEPVPDATNS